MSSQDIRSYNLQALLRIELEQASLRLTGAPNDNFRKR